MSIRIKVILPYLLLTFLIAITGAYVVTRLVTDSLSERLNNQLLEAGRVVSDNFARQESQHIENARIVIFTRGVAEALVESDHTTLIELLVPTASGVGIENIFIVDMQNQEMLHLLGQADGSLSDVTKPGQETSLGFVKPVLASNGSDTSPTRTISKDPENNHWYYFTAVPIVVGEEMSGVVVIGTSIETLMPLLKSTSLADVIIYGENGQAIASTFQAQGDENEIFLKTLSMPVSLYQEVITAESLVSGENISVGERSYTLARGKLKVGNDILGVFAVVLPSDYVRQTSAQNRDLYVVIFSVAMIVVVLLGYFIARLIINPLSSLVSTSQAIADGDLTKRTGINSRDEIGKLASTFDEMTVHLQKRTEELEHTNRILEQMDRTKVSFIHISAHELRTPLTLIQGYSYILQQMAEKDSELETVANGLMDGFTRMEEVVNSMLDVSRIDSKTLEIKPDKSKLSFVIAKAKKLFESAFKERNLEFITEGLDKLPVIPADTELLSKVFYHVIMNAIKYTPDGGKIIVSGKVVDDSTDNSKVEISVRDTGIGIAEQNQEIVFEKFYQTGEVLMHSSGKTKFKGGGPGLGLAIARGIVEAHGGCIWLESPGYDEVTTPGTTVFVRLPLNGQEQ